MITAESIFEDEVKKKSENRSNIPTKELCCSIGIMSRPTNAATAMNIESKKNITSNVYDFQWLFCVLTVYSKK